jgi:hypothetical protein
MESFIRSFWLSFVGIALALFLGLHAWWSFHLAKLPARPPFPQTRAGYISSYGDGGYVVHYLYLYGLFGMGPRMQASDVILLGPSHVELGLSAAALSRELSASTGRPVRVYNLGVGYGDSVPFDKDVLDANGVRNKPAVVDLYMPYGDDISAYAKKVEASTTFAAYLTVGDLWLRAGDDWLLDPWLPSFRLISDQSAPTIKTSRMLRAIMIRRWENGDMLNIWQPENGFIYANSPPAWNLPFTQDDPRQYDHAHDMVLSEKMVANLKSRAIRPIYTLIPYDGYLPGTAPALAQPFLTLTPDGLTFIDTNHLNASGREIATQRLFDGLKNQGDLASWIWP